MIFTDLSILNELKSEVGGGDVHVRGYTQTKACLISIFYCKRRKILLSEFNKLSMDTR